MTEKSMIMNRKRNRKQCMVKRYSCLFTAIIKEVKSINSLTDVDKIYAGQRIVIPYYSTELK